MKSYLLDLKATREAKIRHLCIHLFNICKQITVNNLERNDHLIHRCVNVILSEFSHITSPSNELQLMPVFYNTSPKHECLRFSQVCVHAAV